MRCGSFPSPGILPPFKKCRVPPEGRIYGNSWSRPGGVDGVLYILPDHPNLDLSVSRQGPRHQVRVTVGAAYSLVETVLEVNSLPRHPESAGLCIVTHKHKVCLTIHSHCISHIGMEIQSVKQLFQGVKLLLKAVLMRRRKNPIVCVKILRLLLHAPPKPLRSSRSRVRRLFCFCHHGDPVS